MDYPKDSGLLMLKISIITVVFNRVDVISDALESVQSQTYGNVEHVIIDGGSTDGTIQKIKDCQNKNHIFLAPAKTSQPKAVLQILIIITGLRPILSDKAPKKGALKNEKNEKTQNKSVTVKADTPKDST